MRKRAALVSAVLVLTVLFGPASAASAQTNEAKQTEIAKCVQEALDAGSRRR